MSTVTVPFLYVNILALCCYVLMLSAILAVKRTSEIRLFILVLLAFTLWSGGSLLMRLQVYPGVAFWFYLSLMALFTLPVLLFFFICNFSGTKGKPLKTIWTITTAILLLLTVRGVFLKPPVLFLLNEREAAFLYDMTWKIAIPFAVLLCIVISTLIIIAKMIRDKGIYSPGILLVILGFLSITAGNMMQMVSGNVFPWDSLSGIVFALFLIIALYKKRSIRMTLLISRNILLFIAIFFCFLAAVYWVKPIESFILNIFPIAVNHVNAIVVVFFSIFFIGIYMALKKTIEVIFTREEKHSKTVKHFSNKIAQSLDSNEIMAALIQVIGEIIPVEGIYICVDSGEGFSERYKKDFLAEESLFIAKDSPVLQYLLTEGSYFLLDDFRGTSKYRFYWQREKELFQAYGVRCVGALRDGENITGLVLLTGKKRDGSFTYEELSFLDTVNSITSIAMKNAWLYEQVYRESRVDGLTGVYNYKYFIEKADNIYKKYQGSLLSLLFLDVDDFKLYNQLYGVGEGDYALKKIAAIIAKVMGNKGLIFRYSGKVFAVFLPGLDGDQAVLLANDIQQQVNTINISAQRSKLKTLTLSGGISVSPQTAGSAKELIESANVALYNAKNAGKGKITLYRGQLAANSQIVERVMTIIERPDMVSGSSYEEYSSTILALTAAIDAKDHYTYSHSQNVAKYASILACAIGLNDDEIRLVYEASLLHDIGKISIPEAILSKVEPLTDEEYEIMKGHVNNSIDIIRHLPHMDYIIPAAVGHHERWDGKGYPSGQAGEDIPIAARCLAIADSFEAMTTERPYRKKQSLSYALEEIEKNAGTQFDPRLAKVFIELVEAGEITIGTELF